MSYVTAVASYGRAGKVSTVDVFPEGVIVVPERQGDSYRALQRLPDGWSIATVPDERDGNIAKKRNAILDLFRGSDLLMLDDDYDYLGMWQQGIDIHLDHDAIRHLLAEGFRMAREMGTVLWGVNVQVDRRFYREHAPFSTISPVLGPFLALTSERPDDLRFDEDLFLKEDYDFSLEVLRRYRAIWRYSAVHYKVDHFNESGGVVGTRDMGEEVRQLHRLQQRWGSDVVKIQLHRSVNPILKVPLKGI